MKPALLPATESERLRELKSLDVLDSGTEKQFDDIVQLASSICGTPISLITLIDQDRQWFKASQGLAISETPRDISFCAHAILNDELFEVKDTREDERFVGNPLVEDDPSIRFYAGYPLTTSAGHNIGTLCVIDTEKRALTEEQKTALMLLARQVVKELELRKANRELATVNTKLQRTEYMLLEAEKVARISAWKNTINTGEFNCTEQLRLLLRIPKGNSINSFNSLMPYLAEQDRTTLIASWQNAVIHGKPIDQIVSLSGEEEKIWMHFKSSVIYENGVAKSVIGTVQDITQVREAENLLQEERAKAEKTAQTQTSFFRLVNQELLKPLVKLSMQTEQLLQSPELGFEHQDALRTMHFTLQRLQALINDVQDYSHLHDSNVELTNTPFLLKDQLRRLHSTLYARAAAQHTAFDLVMDPMVPDKVVGDPVRLTQVLNKLLGNALEVTPGKHVELSVRVVYHSDQDWVIEFLVSDTGPGIASEKLKSILENPATRSPEAVNGSVQLHLGLALTRQVVKWQQGELSLQSTVGQGTVATVRLPYRQP
jgi:signal transduction histidine kinase